MFLIFITFSGQGGFGGLRPIWVWLFPLTSDHPLDSHKLFDNDDDDDENYDDDKRGFTELTPAIDTMLFDNETVK